MKIGNLKVYGIVYKITNKINKKVYIGITKQKNGFKDRYHRSGKGIERVYKYHKKRKEHNRTENKELLSDIEYYGLNAFEVIEIFDVAFTMEELKIKEKSWIAIYDSFNNGYNGDKGGLYDGEAIGTIREVICLNDMKVYKNAMVVSDTYEVSYSFLIDKLKTDISNIATIKGYSFMYYENYNKLNYNDKIRYSYIEIDTRDTRVVCLNNGEIYENAKYLEDKFGFFESNISACCREETKSAYQNENGEKLVWRYYENYVNMTEEDIQNALDNAYATNGEKVVCLNTREVFDNARYGAEKYNISDEDGIRDCCRNDQSYCGKLPNGTPLVWRYYEDYLNMSEENIKEAIEKAIYSNNTAVVCLNTREIFKTTKEADEKYNCYGCINKVCNKNRKTCGKLEDGTLLTWVYYEDYINMTEEDIQERIVWSQSYEYGGSSKKKVRCIDMDRVFESITDCSRKLNIDRKSIRQCCNKTRETAKGHRFEFYFEEEIA